MSLVERTVVLVKPDAVERRLAGQIISRLEQAGLTLEALKAVRPSRQMAEGHYPNTVEWLRGMGEKTLRDYEERGLDPIVELGTDDPVEIGGHIKEWNIDYLSSGLMIASIWRGPHAIESVRKICGNTLPVLAGPGTIRGDFSTVSASVANAERSAIRNLVHASGDREEASHEIAYWFPELRAD